MARIVLSEGACPVCAATVRRAVHLAAGAAHEVFLCHNDGRLAYGAADVPLAALAAAGDVPMLLA